MNGPHITEVNKDAFWTLIDQAKEHSGGPSEWLMERLVSMGPEQAKRFDTIARVYTGRDTFQDFDPAEYRMKSSWPAPLPKRAKNA